MVYMKTEAGQRALKDRTVALSPRQRSIFILFNGQRELADVLRAATALAVAEDDIEHMVRLGLLAPANDAPPAAPAASDDPQARYRKAHAIALRLTSELGLKGFQLNLAVEEALDAAALLRLLPQIREQAPPQQFRALEMALRGL